MLTPAEYARQLRTMHTIKRISRRNDLYGRPWQFTATKPNGDQSIYIADHLWQLAKCWISSLLQHTS